MPARLPKADSDVKVWGLALNDALRILHGNDTIVIAKNGNNPPTVKAGTRFFRWNVDTYLTPLTPPTGNNSYPVNTNITYPISDVIFEQSDVTFEWGAGGVPSKSNSTLYILSCYGSNNVDAAGRGKGLYRISTTAAANNKFRGGWYDMYGNRCLCAFYVNSSGAVENIVKLTSDLIAYTHVGTATTSVALSGLSIVDNGGRLKAFAVCKQATTAAVGLQINGVTAPAYAYETFLVNGTTLTGARATAQGQIALTPSVASGNEICADIDIIYNSGMNYVHVNCQSTSSQNSVEMYKTAGFYNSAASLGDITSITLLSGTNGIGVGSFVTIYKA